MEFFKCFCCIGCCLLLSSFIGNTLASIADIAWSQSAAFPYDATRITGTALNGFGYGAGGDNRGVCGNVGQGGTGFYRFDPVMSSWTALEPPPLCTTTADNLCAVNGFIYKPGGLDASLYIPSDSFLVFNTASAVWSFSQPLPEPLWKHAAVAFQMNSMDFVITFGGRNLLNEMSDVVYAFNVYENSWEIISYLPAGPREALSAAVARDENGKLKIYVIGGLDSLGVIVPTVEEFDPEVVSWRTLAPLPTPVYFHTCETTLDPFHPSSDLVHVIGGDIGTTQLNRVQLYETATNTWHLNNEYSFNTRRRSHGSFVIDNDLFIFAGWNGDYLRAAEKGETYIYTPTPSPSPSPTPTATPSPTETPDQPQPIPTLNLWGIGFAIALLSLLFFRFNAPHKSN